MSNARIAKADFQREIIKMAGEDKAFCQQLLANPKQALKAAIGFDPPAGVDIKVVQESPSLMYLVLPPDASAFKAGTELGDEDLKAVAGGAGALGQQLHGFAGGNFLQRFQNERLLSGPGSKLGNAAIGVSVSWG